ncbi:MAG TPA: penicillin-binding transpeptidase domain-containing protein, partial [Acidimicrobiales bacterium]|nr:penicillin-binding transpeptidase domain-containing protein [Acidimicrobiales bacterium]
MGRRIRLLGLGMLLCFAVLLLQLTNIQVVKAHQYATAPRNPAVIAAHTDQPRGIIQSADGVVLADSVPASSGVYKYQRQYPTAGLFSHVVGYLSPIYGSTGVESSYNQYLVAHDKPVKTLGDLLSTATVTDTVTLTMNSVLQKDAVTALGGRDGAVVVLNPGTGAIEAMYSNPTFDPNPLVANDTKTEQLGFLAANTRNPKSGFAPAVSLAYQDIFPPGSTFKTVTTAATYDHSPQLVNVPMPYYNCIPPHTFGGQTTPLCNYGASGCGGTIAVMLPPSCDTGYAVLGTKVGAPGMQAEAASFGFNQQPPLDLPHSAFQVSRFLQPSCYQHAQVYLAFSSIGQKCTIASPLQMALVAAAFANSGTIMTPHVVSQIRDSQGNLVSTYKPVKWLDATSPATSAAVTTLMQHVVQYGTAAGVGFPPQDQVAAKTGTAQIGTGNTATTDWMIAFAPASHPKVALAVVIPNQSLSATGAEVAGPVMNYMIQA